MKKQHQVILSLGSNLGNRLENIERCIWQLHQEIGTVIHVSKLYETPALGFESDSFYNCALVLHSPKTASQILAEVLALEQRLGRIRTKTVGYQSRIIDIDIIAYNEEIIDSALTLPHPEMQNRLFVLMPMRDLNLEWRHPVLKKYLHELMLISEDKSNCTIVKNLDNPLHKIAFKSVQLHCY